MSNEDKREFRGIKLTTPSHNPLVERFLELDGRSQLLRIHSSDRGIQHSLRILGILDNYITTQVGLKKFLSSPETAEDLPPEASSKWAFFTKSARQALLPAFLSLAEPSNRLIKGDELAPYLTATYGDYPSRLLPDRKIFEVGIFDRTFFVPVPTAVSLTQETGSSPRLASVFWQDQLLPVEYFASQAAVEYDLGEDLLFKFEDAFAVVGSRSVFKRALDQVVSGPVDIPPVDSIRFRKVVGQAAQATNSTFLYHVPDSHRLNLVLLKLVLDKQVKTVEDWRIASIPKNAALTSSLDFIRSTPSIATRRPSHRRY